MHACIHTYIHTYTHTHIHTYTHIYIHTCNRSCAASQHVRACTHKLRHAITQVHKRTHTHKPYTLDSSMQKQVHSCIIKCTPHAHTHTHTHTLTPFRQFTHIARLAQPLTDTPTLITANCMSHYLGAHTYKHKTQPSLEYNVTLGTSLLTLVESLATFRGYFGL